jgi:hypothetical protein
VLLTIVAPFLTNVGRNVHSKAGTSSHQASGNRKGYNPEFAAIEAKSMAFSCRQRRSSNSIGYR